MSYEDELNEHERAVMRVWNGKNTGRRCALSVWDIARRAESTRDLREDWVVYMTIGRLATRGYLIYMRPNAGPSEKGRKWLDEDDARQEHLERYG